VINLQLDLADGEGAHPRGESLQSSANRCRDHKLEDGIVAQPSCGELIQVGVGDAIRPGAHTGFGKDVPQVRLHGVHRDQQAVSDVDGRGALQHGVWSIAAPVSQAIGRHQ
jgi:hypothetical protein